MSPLAPLLIAGSAAIIMLLGLIHLLYTFYGPKLLPRDRDLKARMQEVSLVITRETTMWKAWVGFNASHSYGAILFGAVYGYLSLGAQCVLVPVHVPSVAWAVAAWWVCFLGQTLLVQRAVSRHPSGNHLLCHRAHHQLGLTQTLGGRGLVRQRNPA